MGDLKQIELAPGLVVPAMGQGTWAMGEHRNSRRQEVAALRYGIELGLSVIDTAEMYGEGGAEEVVGEAILGQRDKVVLVSKVYPHNATGGGTIQACERSLARLGTDRLDLYLLHWRGGVPLGETVEAMERLRRHGKILHYGVSNFDVEDIRAWQKAGGRAASNQILYNLARRGPEFDLLPWSRQNEMSVMAYSPIEQGRLTSNPVLKSVATRRNVTPAAVALAWLVRQEGVIAIPKASQQDHVSINRRALDLVLTEAEVVELETAFPPPKRKVPLAML